MQMRDATAKDIAAIVLLHMESWRSAYGALTTNKNKVVTRQIGPR
jgi:hypothetical protein